MTTRADVAYFASYSREKLSNGWQSAKFEVLQNFEIRSFSESLGASKGVLSFFFRSFAATLRGVRKFDNSRISKTAIHTDVQDSALYREDYSGKKSSYQQGADRQYLRRYTQSQNRKFAPIQLSRICKSKIFIFLILEYYLTYFSAFRTILRNFGIKKKN